MKRGLLLCSALALFVVIASFFGPLVIVQNNAIPTYFVLFCTSFSPINMIFIIGYLAFIGAFVCLYFLDKHESMILNSMLLFIISGFIFLFSSPLSSFILNSGDNIIHIGASGVVLATLSFTGFIFLNLIPREKSMFSIYDIVEIAMLISFAVVLDLFVKIPIGATGGSINLAMLPLMVIALRHNFYKSFIGCGLVYGLTTCLTDGYGLVYLPFDYILGFGSVAVVSLFRKLILKRESSDISILGILFLLLSLVCVFVLRTLSSTISSMVYYGYTFDAGIVYNITYIGPSVAACFIVLLLLYKPLAIINKRYCRV